MPIELEISVHNRGRNHCNVFTTHGDFVGFVSPSGNHINVQRCAHCRKENYVLAIVDGVCAWCRWDANNPEDATISHDSRKHEGQ